MFKIALFFTEKTKITTDITSKWLRFNRELKNTYLTKQC